MLNATSLLEEFKFLEFRHGILRTLVLGSPDHPAVLLMPDPPNIIEHMLFLLKDLAHDHRVIAVEAPGFGFSRAKPGYCFTIDQQAALICELMESLQVHQGTMALTCVATLSGLRAAHLRPDLLSRAVFAQSSSLRESQAWAKRVDFKGIIGTPLLGQLAMRLGREAITREWYRNALPRTADLQPYLVPTLGSFRKGASFCLASAFQALQRERLTVDDLRIKGPAILLWGQADRTHRKTDKASLRQYAPQLVIRETQEAGHFPDLETPELFARAIRDVAKM